MFHFLNSKKKAFTLIEMLVVIAIIGILSSMILVGMGGARAKARDARRIADLHNVQNVLELYFAQNGKYPAAPTGTGPTAWSSFANTLINAGLGVSQIPSDPINDTTNYYYRYGTNSPNFTTYTLGAKLEQNDPALTTDIDETNSNGINCTDPVYCIKP